MKHLIFLCLFLFSSSLGFSQYYDADFLDGTIMFKLHQDPISHNKAVQKDVNDYSLIININEYPELQMAFSGMTVLKLEKPSYFTHKSQLENIFRITFAENDQIEEVLRRLKTISNIEYAEKEPIYKIDFIPNDTYHTGNNKWYHTLVGSENAWNISQGSNNIKVAIVDNAVFCGHSDLTTYAQYDVADNDNNATPPLVSSVDFGWSHGTHCAGLATADMNNGIGIASLGANVELIGVKATPNSASNSGSLWYTYEGVQWACQNGANVVSMSFGSGSSSSAMQTLINSYPQVVFIAAAGNDNSTALMYPGAYNNVICVGSVDANDSRSSFSNYNGSTPFVDIASPGGYSYGGLYSTVYTSGGNGYDQMGGTSMATPFAAGLVGLMLSVNPTLTPTQIQTCIISTGVNINQSIGPRINALAALQCVESTLTGDPVPFFNGTPLSIIEGNNVTFNNLSVDGGNPITNYTWSFPGGTPSSFVGMTPPAIQYLSAGTYDVTLQVTNSQSTQSLTQTAYVNVTIQPYGEWIEEVSAFTAASRGINHISIVDPNVVWALAYDGTATAANVQEFTKTINGGATWTPGTINVQNTNLGISMIHAFDANKAWLAAYPTAAGQTGGIWITNNGGTTWTRQNTATFSNAASFTNIVHFWDANIGFCQGDPINGEFEMYTTINGGTTWTLVPAANIPNPLNANEFGYVRGIEVVGDHVWFTTSVGRVYHSTNRGVNWTVNTSPVADFGGAVTTGVTANLSYASTTDGLIVNNSGAVYKTVNGGTSWTPVITTGSVFTNGLCFIEGTNIAFTTGAAAGASGSSYSADGGTTWNIIDTEQHLYVEFTNPSVGWSGWFNADAVTAGIWKWNNLSSTMVPDFSTSPLTVCVNAPVNYTDNTSGSAPVSWQWLFPGGTPSTSTLQNPVVTYASAGIYDVTLTVIDAISQTSETKLNYITVVAPVVAPSVISGPNSICALTTNTYSVINNPTVVYNWTIPVGWTGTSFTNSINVTDNATSGTIEVTAENVCGPSASSTLAISVEPGAPTASFTSSNIANNYTFTSTSTDAATWNWDFGDGGTSTVENPNYVYLTNGTFTVTLTITNGCGTEFITQSVTISGVGINENDQDLLNYYPNPSDGNLTIDFGKIDGEKTIKLFDLSGKQVYETNTQEMILNLNLNLSTGFYQVVILTEENAMKLNKKLVIQ